MRGTLKIQSELLTGVYKSDVRNYDMTFNELLGRGGLAEVVRDRRKRNLPAVVLDVMSDPTVVRELQPDAGLAIGLTDTRDPAERAADNEHDIDMIVGNVLSKQTWRQVQQWLEQHAPAKVFDLILARPVAGISTLSNEPEVYYFILNQMWKTLSPNDGTLLAETLLLGQTKEVFLRWLKVVRKTEGMTVHTGGAQSTLRLTKFSKAPIDLPIMKI